MTPADALQQLREAGAEVAGVQFQRQEDATRCDPLDIYPPGNYAPALTAVVEAYIHAEIAKHDPKHAHEQGFYHIYLRMDMDHLMVVVRPLQASRRRLPTHPLDWLKQCQTLSPLDHDVGRWLRGWHQRGVRQAKLVVFHQLEVALSLDLNYTMVPAPEPLATYTRNWVRQVAWTEQADAESLSGCLLIKLTTGELELRLEETIWIDCLAPGKGGARVTPPTSL